MKRFGEILQGIGFFGILLFGSGADLNEISVTIGGMLACTLMIAAGVGFDRVRIRSKRRTARRNICRGTASAAGLVVAAGMLAAVFNIANAEPAHAETIEVAEEPIIIEIHSEYDAIEITEAPPIETAAEPKIEPKADAAAGFVYIHEIPLSYDQQKTLYTLWTGAGYDYTMALALADQETGGTFSTTAINHNTHDYGLFQLNRKSWQGTFRRVFGVSSMEEMLDYELNIRGAIYVYGDCVDRYGETERAVVAYNMGSAKYDSTKYSRSVMAKYQKWADALAAAKGM